MKTKEWRDHYIRRGFTLEAHFPDDDPYDLFFLGPSPKKARVYDSGRVIETDAITGEYFIVQL